MPQFFEILAAAFHGIACCVASTSTEYIMASIAFQNYPHENLNGIASMRKTIIKLSYRKIIDSSSQKQWEKYIFEDSFTEFLMQSQYFDQQKKYSSFSELIANVP